MVLQLSAVPSELGVLSQRRSKSLQSHLLAGRRANAPAVPRRRRSAGVLASASGGQELEGAPVLPPAPAKGVSRLAQIAAGAAMLLPLAAATLGLYPGVAHAARPAPQGGAAVAERSGPSTVIDEESGTAQPWLYSRGPWNQKQYATIHEFYAEPGKLRKARGGSTARTAPSRSEVQQQQQAASAAAAAAPTTARASAASAALAAKASEVGSVARHAAGVAKQAAGHAAITAKHAAGTAAGTAKQAAGHAAVTAKQAAGHAAITGKQAAGHAAVFAKGAAGTAKQAVGHAAITAKQAAGTAGHAVAGYAHDFAARVDNVGAQVTDQLAATDLHDPQTQKALAAMSTAMLALFIFAARQRSLAGSRRPAFDSTDSGSTHSRSTVSGSIETDTDTDSEEGSRSLSPGSGGSSSSGGLPRRDAALAMAGASTVRWADLSLEERQVEAARRITAAKRRILQVKAGQDERAAASDAEEEQEAEVAEEEEAVPAAVAPAAPAFPPAVGAAASADREGQRQQRAAAEAAAAAEREAQRQRQAAATAAAAAEREAQRQRQAAEAAAAEAEAAVLVDTQVIAEGGSVGKLTTDAAAAQAVAAEVAVALEKERLARLAGQLESRDKGAEQAATAAAAPAVEKGRLQKLAGLLWRRDKAATAAVADDLAATREKERLAQLAGVLEAREETATQGMADEAAAAAARDEEAAVAAEKERLGQLAGVLQARAETAAQGMAEEATLAAEKARLGQLAGVLEARDEAAEAVLARGARRQRGAGDGGERYLETSKDPAAPSLVLFGFLAAAADAMGPLLGRPSSSSAAAAAAASAATSAPSTDADAEPLVPGAAATPRQQQQQASQWDALSILLAPAAPLLASIVGSKREVVRRNKYDMLLDVLAAAAAAPEVQGNSQYDPVRSLLALAPPSGVPRYDFARSLLRGMAAADTSGDGTFDMAAGLLQSVRDGSLVPTGASKYDPVWPLLKEAAMLQEWGASKFDPVHGLSDWVAVPSGDTAFAGLRHDPWADLVAAARDGKAAGVSKYDPLPALLSALSGAADAPGGASRYDPAAGLLALAASPSWHGPSGGSRYCMVAAALDAAAGWQAPQGASKFDPAAAVLAAEAPSRAAAGASRRWDPLAWLMDGWAANSGDWDPARDGGGKFDPAPAVLGAAAPRRSHGSKFDPVQDLTAGEWVEPALSGERSVPANSAAARPYGSGMTQQQQQQQPPLEPAPLGAQTGGWM